MLQTYRAHVAERAALGIPPLPLSAKQTGEFKDLVKSGIAANMAFFMNDEFQTTMFQPVGGMDMIGKGFARQVDRLITYNAKVTKLMQDKKGVSITYTDLVKGGTVTAEAEFCVCTIPLTVLSQIETNLSDKKTAAIQAVPYSNSVKIGLEMRRRFWEEDSQIYGGISWTDQDILQLWYPPHAFHQQKGIMLGSYQWDTAVAERWAQLKPAERLVKAIAEGEKIHPGYGGMVEKGLSVAWSKVPYMFGCSAEWSDAARAQHYPTLVAAEGAHYMVGDQISFHGGWQEGAIRSAHRVIEDIARRVAA